MKFSRDKTIYYTLSFVLLSYFIIMVILIFLTQDEKLQNLLVIPFCIMLFLFAPFISKIDYKYSEYQCNYCGSYFKPTFSEYFWGVKLWKSGQTKYLVCSKCGKKGWCKRKLKF